MTCPSCDGKGKEYAHVNRGDQPHTWEWVPCLTCNGSGEITAERKEAIELGEAIREARKAPFRYKTQREMAARIGLTGIDLSQAEAGRFGVERTRAILELVRQEQAK